MRRHTSKSRYINYITAALALVLAAIACWFIFAVDTPLISNISFNESICGLDIEPYYDSNEDIYYLFLPSYVSSGDVNVISSASVNVDFSDETTDYGNKLESIPLQENISLTLTAFKQQEEYTIQIWQCEDVYTLYLKSLAGSLDDVNEDKDYELEASAIIINPDGTVELNEMMSTLSGRGNGSWKTDGKKPYTLKLSSAADFGSFTSVKNLCLLANYSDESRIRNSISYYAGESLGIDYASPYMNADVYVDGEYIGLYGLTTKNEYKKYTDSDGIKAVFEMKISNISEDQDSFDSGFSSRVNVMYGDIDDIQETVGRFETALRTQDWELCHSVIDLHSFAEKYIFEEFIANHDLAYGSSYQSKYFYIDNDDIIHCMLPWDYDWSFGSDVYFFNDLQLYCLKGYRSPNGMYYYLLQDDEFINEVIKVLNDEFTDEYLDDLCRYTDQLTDEIDSSWKCDKRRWKDEPQYGSVKNSYGIETLGGFSEFFKDYFYERRSFLIDYFSDIDNYCILELRAAINTSEEYFNMAIPKGENIWTYITGANIINPGRRSSYELSGWYTDDGISLYDIDVLTEDMTFKATWEKKG